MSDFYVETNRIETNQFECQDSYPEPTNYLKIDITDPITHTSTSSKFTDYAIVTNTNMPIFKFKQACVRRRYSDFEFLKNYLETNLNIVLTGFPPKAITKQLPFSGGLGIFDPNFIEKRREQLESFINKIAQNPNIKTKLIFHNFLQSIVFDKNPESYKS